RLREGVGRRGAVPFGVEDETELILALREPAILCSCRSRRLERRIEIPVGEGDGGLSNRSPRAAAALEVPKRLLRSVALVEPGIGQPCAVLRAWRRVAGGFFDGRLIPAGLEQFARFVLSRNSRGGDCQDRRDDETDVEAVCAHDLSHPTSSIRLGSRRTSRR